VRGELFRLDGELDDGDDGYTRSGRLMKLSARPITLERVKCAYKEKLTHGQMARDRNCQCH
jgi:hypothetical protein